MGDTIPTSSGPTDADLELARKAVERGWVSLVKLEEAITRGGDLVDGLALTEIQVRELRAVHAPTRPVPGEVQSVTSDPARRVGRYVLLNLLGRGGMGSVYRAWDSDLRRMVALKFLTQVGDETARAYFRREALVAAGLDHPNVAKIHEIGEHEGAPFLAMQYVDGDTVAKLAGGMDLARKIGVLRQVGEAIRYAHAKGVIHRDLKPANVMIDKGGTVYVMDFGLAKETGVEGQSLTETGSVMGTPQYMAPEQARGKADAQSDVYSIGAILYELVTGRPPYVGETAADVLWQVMEADVLRPRQLAPTLPEDVEAITIKALEKERKARYANVGELIDDLDAYANGEPIRHARRVTWAYVMAKRIRKRPLVWTFGAAMILAILGGGTFSLLQFAKAQSERRKQDAVRRLSYLWSSAVERKHAMRNRPPRAETRAELLEAAREVSAFIASWPDLPQGYYIRARIRYSLGELEAAEVDLKRAIALAGDFRPAWTFLSTVKLELYQERMITISELIGERIAESSPILQEAADAHGRGWVSGREREEGERWGLAPTSEDLVAGIVAESLLAVFLDKNPEKGRQILDQAWDRLRAEECLLMMGLQTSKHDEAIAIFTKVIDRTPGYFQAYYHRGLRLAARGDFDRAIADYDIVLTMVPDYANAFGSRGWAKQMKGDPEGALSDYDRAIALRPGDFNVYFNRASALSAKGDWPASIRDFDTSIRLKPDYAHAYFARACARTNLGDLDGALADFDRALALNPRHSDALYWRGRMRFDRSDLDGAITDFDRALQVVPNLGDALYRRGLAKYHKGDPQGAMRDFTSRLELDPENVLTYYWRGRAGFESGFFRVATDDFSEALKRKEDDPDARFWRGRCHHEIKNWTGARDDFSRAIELRGKDPEAWRWRGEVRQKLGEDEGAIADFTRALELKPEHAEARYGRGRVRIQRNEFESAVSDFDRCLELRKDWADPLAMRGLARKGLGDRKGALADLTRALELDPERTGIFAVRGYIQFQRRAWAEAESDFRKACERVPERQDYPRLYLWLLRARTDRRDEADSDLRSYLGGRPSDGEGDWPPTIARFLLGEADEPALFVAVQGSDVRDAEARFYAGMKRLVGGDTAGAIARFRECVKSGKTSLSEYWSARAELETLEK